MSKEHKAWRDPATHVEIMEQETKRNQNPVNITTGVIGSKFSDQYRPAHPDGQNIPPVSHFQRCSESDIFKEKDPGSDPEPLTGLAIFLLVMPEGHKLGIAGATAFSFLLLLYFLFSFGAKRQRKIKGVKKFVASQEIPETSMRHPDNLGVDAAAYRPLIPKNK